ncbi:MAG: BrnA antitoxin family protein [SAR324 cluster bacterium]|mgnify:FL=1|jgi:hypothetical protein|nr:BrnA antitoxin family protein [SAR324 cluster bacterium]|tara:strand:+ start:312 stop:590 length:279 start_codon:yes stop_codon:yes gene_type:complete
MCPRTSSFDYIAHGLIGDRLHVVVFTPVNGGVRVISFRKANKREVKAYASKRSAVSTTVRFDAEVLEFFRATGKGWQTRMNEVLRGYVASQQ